MVACRPAVVKDAELIVRGINGGVAGFNKWSFLNRGDLDGQWQLLDFSKALGKELVLYRLDDMSGKAYSTDQPLELKANDIVTLTTYKMDKNDPGKK